jgi:hypothetical protein
VILSWPAAWLLWTVGGWITAEAWVLTVRATPLYDGCRTRPTVLDHWFPHQVPLSRKG